jgi:hypothetical protein
MNTVDLVLSGKVTQIRFKKNSKEHLLQIANWTKTCAAISIANAIVEHTREPTRTHGYTKNLFAALQHYVDHWIYPDCLEILDGYSFLTNRCYNIQFTCNYDEPSQTLSYRGISYDGHPVVSEGQCVLTNLKGLQKSMGRIESINYTGEGFQHQSKHNCTTKQIIPLTEVLREYENNVKKLQTRIMYSPDNEDYRPQLRALTPQISIINKQINQCCESSTQMSTTAQKIYAEFKARGARAIHSALITNASPPGGFTILPGWIGIMPIHSMLDIDATVSWLRTRYPACWWDAAMYFPVPCCQQVDIDVPEFMQFQNISAKNWMYTSLIRQWIFTARPCCKLVKRACEQYGVQESYSEIVLKYCIHLRRDEL